MSYKFVQNTKCEYFPCHVIDKMEDFNCLFCYCPLYILGDKCGGNPTFTLKGIKSCVACSIVHKKEKGYLHVQQNMSKIIKLVNPK